MRNLDNYWTSTVTYQQLTHMKVKGLVIAEDGMEYPEGPGPRCGIVGIKVLLYCSRKGALNSLPDCFLHSSFGIALLPVKGDHIFTSAAVKCIFL